MSERQKVKLFNNITPFRKDVYGPGTLTRNLHIAEGSRLVFTIYVFSLDPGATVDLKVLTSFSESMPFCDVMTLQGTAPGAIKGVLSDFHGFIDCQLIVAGGNAEVIVGMSVYDNALTTRIENAEIQVDLNHMTQPNGTHDSVRIGDGTDVLEINPDGSINVNIVNTSVVPEIVINPYALVAGIVTSVRTSVVSHTAAAGKETYLQFASVSGDNVADYELEIDGAVIDRRQTYHGGGLSEKFEFTAYSENGTIIPVGQTVEIFVEHCRPDTGDFSGRIQILEIG